MAGSSKTTLKSEKSVQTASSVSETAQEKAINGQFRLSMNVITGAHSTLRIALARLHVSDTDWYPIGILSSTPQVKTRSDHVR